MRRGISLIEVLVVLAIIAILLALLLPSVRRVRHPAMLMKCSNNLKEIGLAAHNYRDTHGHFPPGTIENAKLPPDTRLSWQVALLPYMEQPKLYEKFDRTAAWDAPANASALSAPVAGETQRYASVLRCPAFMEPGPPFWYTNYVGVAGVGPDAPVFPVDGPGVGFFGYDRKLKTEDVKDGLANTFAVIETGDNVGPFVRGGPATVRALDLTDEPLVGEGRPFGGIHRADKTFGGTRPLGARVLMGDGSVRLSQAHVDANVLGALATIAGRDEVPTEW
jgi:prepilin-type N-terminal cleavage/methylation domain-containing protein